jgi:hypothetical protein
MLTSSGTSTLSGDHMRTIAFYFIALLAIPVVQIAFGPRIERAGAPVVIDRSTNIIIAVGKHLRARELNSPTAPRPERRPKPS